MQVMTAGKMSLSWLSDENECVGAGVGVLPWLVAFAVAELALILRACVTHPLAHAQAAAMEQEYQKQPLYLRAKAEVSVYKQMPEAGPREPRILPVFSWQPGGSLPPDLPAPIP